MLQHEQIHTFDLKLSDTPDSAASFHCTNAGTWKITETNRLKLLRKIPVIGGRHGPLRGCYLMIIYQEHFNLFQKYADQAKQQMLSNFA